MKTTVEKRRDAGWRSQLTLAGRYLIKILSVMLSWRLLLCLKGALAFAAAATAVAKEPSKAEAGMAWIPGGEFAMGAATNGHGSGEMAMPSNDAEPIHRVRVDSFWMDKTTVTNEQFEKFVKATNYVTIAERVPTKEEFPTAPAENLVAGSVVFTAPDHEVPLNNHFQWWSYVKGANWRHPLGPESDLKGKEKLSGRACRVSGRGSVREMGGQTSAHGSGV